MKKFLIILLSLLLICSLAACAQNGAPQAPEDGEEDSGQQDSGQQGDADNDPVGGFGTGADIWALDNTGTLALERFKKDRGGKEFDSPWNFWNDAKKTSETWIMNENTGELLVYRMKQTDAWEDITADFPLTWSSREDAADRELIGKTGAGRLTPPTWFTQQVALQLQPEYAFVGAVWYDAIDGMTYAMLSLGENAVLRDPYPTFMVAQHANLDFSSYQEALEFLQLHNYHGKEERPVFARDDGESQTILQMEEYGTISCRVGTENDFVETYYDPDNQIRIQRHKHVTEGTHEVRYAYEGDVLVSKLVFDSNSNLLESYRYNIQNNTTNREQFENGVMVYSYSDSSQATTEGWYSEKEYKQKRYDKAQKITTTRTYKVIREGEALKHYIVSVEADWGYTKYTYASEDSVYLVRMEDYRIAEDEKVIWTLNGTACNDSMDYVISLERTIKGKTRFYTREQIPWGTGMVYPPQFQHELNN